MRPRPRAPQPTNKMTPRSGLGRPAVTSLSGAGFRPRPTSEGALATGPARGGRVGGGGTVGVPAAAGQSAPLAEQLQLDHLQLACNERYLRSHAWHT
jgi:hypothetical protein